MNIIIQMAYREYLLSRLIQLLGYEHPFVNEFAGMCDNFTQSSQYCSGWTKCLETTVDAFFAGYPRREDE